MQFEKTLGTIATAISLVMILASYILVTNTLMMSVSERSREFGILAQAVGLVFGVGTLAAFYPAWRVTRLTP